MRDKLKDTVKTGYPAFFFISDENALSSIFLDFFKGNKTPPLIDKKGFWKETRFSLAIHHVGKLVLVFDNTTNASSRFTFADQEGQPESLKEDKLVIKTQENRQIRLDNAS